MVLTLLLDTNYQDVQENGLRLFEKEFLVPTISFKENTLLAAPQKQVPLTDMNNE